METISLLTVQLKRQSLAESGAGGSSAAQDEFQCDSGVGSSDGFLSTSPLPMLRHQQQHEEDDVAVTGFSPPRAFSHPMLSSLTTTHALPANAFSDLSLPHQSNRNLDLNIPSQGDIGHVLADNCLESPSMRLFNVTEFGSGNGKVKVGAEGRKWPLTTALSMIDVTTSSDEEVCDLLSSQGPYLLLLPPTDNNSCTSIERMSTNVKKRGSLSVMSSWSSEGEVDSLRCVSPCKRHCSAADISPAAAQSHQHPLQQEPSPSDHSVWEDFRRDQRPCLDFEKMIKRTHKYNGTGTTGGRGKLVKVKVSNNTLSSGANTSSASPTGLFDPSVFTFQPISWLA